MTKSEYKELATQPGASRLGVFLHGSVNPIVILAVPMGRLVDYYFEGFVVWSECPELYPVGYCSLAWNAENFERISGTLSFQP